MSRCFVFLLIVPMILGAVNQPAPSVTGVQNAASNIPAGYPASGIAQGSIFTVYGSSLGPATCNQAFAFPVPATMCGVSATVTVNGTSVAPLLLGVYNGNLQGGFAQINAILPSLTPTGNGTIAVTYNNQTSAAFPIQVVTAAFGTFTPNYGYGQASVTDVNYSLNTIIHTLHPGDIGILWGTGLGPITQSDAIQPPFGNVGSPTVYVGNTALTTSPGILYAGRSGSWPGLDQINFTVPQGVQGCYVPIAVQVGGVVSNVGTIAVAAAGQSTCSDSPLGQTLLAKLAAGNNVSFGYLQLQSINLTFSGLTFTGSAGNGDYAYATFSGFTPQTAYQAEYGVSSGYCVSDVQANPEDLSPAQLDAGSALSLQGPLVAPPIPQYFPGSGGYGVFLAASGKFLYSDYHYTMTGMGGAKVGAFSVTETSSLPSAKLTGLNGQSFPRSSDLTIQWNGGSTSLRNAPTTIGGASFNSDGTVGTEFQCTAPAGATTFTVPSWILSTLPPTGSVTSGSETIPRGYIWIGQYNTPTTFTAPGLDLGIMTDIFFQGAIIYFQ